LLAPSQRLTENESFYASDTFRSWVKNGSLILLWYMLSTMLTLYNKELLGKHKGLFGEGFEAPMFMTAVQFTMQWLISWVVLRLTCCPPTMIEGTADWYEWATQTLPNAASTGLDIGLSNRSLAYITVSFYTMCKSTVPLWLLTFAFVFRVESPSWGLFGVVVIICIGLVLLVAGETQFHFLGFMMVMTAAMLSGFRWTITQIQLQGKAPASPKASDGSEGSHQVSDTHDKKASPVAVMYRLYPIMALTVFLMSLVSDNLWVVLATTPYFSTTGHTLITLCAITMGSILAFCMVWTEFKVIQETSAITFTVAGTFKEVVTVISSVIVFGDEFHAINALGLVVLLAGCGLFNYIKMQKLKKVTSKKMLKSPMRAGELLPPSADALHSP